MIPIEKLCITLEQAKKLKELGVEQDSHYYWGKYGSDEWMIVNKATRAFYEGEDETYSAFTSGELSYMIYEDVFIKDLFEDIEYYITTFDDTKRFNRVIKE